MMLKETLVKIRHDEGYGDDLLWHINLALRGKDMEAVEVAEESESSRKLSLWMWTTEMNCTVQRDAALNSPTPWWVLDVDGECIGRGATPNKAIEAAYLKVEGKPAV